jgi:hypothetical protein
MKREEGNDVGDNRRTITEFELVDHGIEGSQYFQGCGISFTEFTDIATGCGDDPREAIEDALEQLACGGWDVDGMEKRICADIGRRKLPRKPSVPRKADDSYYYVSLRVKE